MRPALEAAAVQLMDACLARQIMLATAESCTGGLVSGALTAIPGSSRVFDRGFVTYSNEAKMELLGVSATLLQEHGAVSEAAARAMAEAALDRSNAGVSVAITGVAGPGGTAQKPEGLVWFATSTSEGTIATRQTYGPLGRQLVRERSVEFALAFALQAVGRLP